MNKENLEELVSEDVNWDDEEDNSVEQESELEISNEEDSISETSVNLGREKYSLLLTIFQILQKPCNDLVVRNGYIRQVSTARSCIFDINVTSILGDETSFMVGDIEQKRKLLDPFLRQNVDVVLDIGENNYVFMDSKSQMSFVHPIPEYIQNKYMKEEDLNDILKIKDERVFQMSLDKTILDRLKSYTDTLEASTLRIHFKDGKAIFKISTVDSTTSTVVNLITIEDEMETSELEGYMPFDVAPFLSCLSGGITEIELELFFRTIEDSFILKVYSQLEVEGVDGNVPVIIWIQSDLKQNN